MNASTPTSEIKILVIGADEAVRATIVTPLARAGYQISETNSCAIDQTAPQQSPANVILFDVRHQEISSATLRSLSAMSPSPEIILLTDMTSFGNVADDIARTGLDCISLPLADTHLLLRVQRAVERYQMRRELNLLRQHVAMSFGFDNIVGISKPMVQLKETAKRVAPTDITVLLTGPSGTGKELFARAIHHHSNRRSGKFVTVDCSSIPEALLESELFGHIKGSFVSATSTQTGLIEEAAGGTLFLHDVSTMPSSVQAKLLRFLQDSEVRPVGAVSSHKVDVRVIASTCRELKTMVDAGSFREDLYFRLNVIPLALPPLAERAEDIEMLIEYFLRKISHEMKGHPTTITRQAVDRLAQHTWPGNVQELENTLKRAAALCSGGQIDANDISFISTDKPPTAELVRPTKISLTFKGSRLDSEQRSLILKTLSDNEWNFTRTAQELGIGRTTLWRKVKKYNLSRQFETAGVES